MIAGLGLILVIGLLIAAWVALRVRKRHVMIWLPSYLKGNWAGRRAGVGGGPIHVLFCIADHFEPALGGASPRLALERVEGWSAITARSLPHSGMLTDGPPGTRSFSPPSSTGPN